MRSKYGELLAAIWWNESFHGKAVAGDQIRRSQSLYTSVSPPAALALSAQPRRLNLASSSLIEPIQLSGQAGQVASQGTLCLATLSPSVLSYAGFGAPQMFRRVRGGLDTFTRLSLIAGPKNYK